MHIRIIQVTMSLGSPQDVSNHTSNSARLDEVCPLHRKQRLQPSTRELEKLTLCSAVKDNETGKNTGPVIRATAKTMLEWQ